MQDHVERYHKLSAKTKIFFSTAVALWDADFYVKVEDDVHVNLGMLITTLCRYKLKPSVCIGCMKSGPVLSDTYNLHLNQPVRLHKWSGQTYLLSSCYDVVVFISQAHIAQICKQRCITRCMVYRARS